MNNLKISTTTNNNQTFDEKEKRKIGMWFVQLIKFVQNILCQNGVISDTKVGLNDFTIYLEMRACVRVCGGKLASKHNNKIIYCC